MVYQKKVRKPPTLNEVLDAAWRAGCLDWKLRDAQLRMYRQIRQSDSLKFVINSARRLGKSYLMCLMAIEDALAQRHVQVRFAAPTMKALRKIILPIFREICKDAPMDVRPIWKVQDGIFYFPTTGSEVHLSGANGGHDEALRGTAAHRFYVDEAGYIDNLGYLLEDILMPQLLTTSGKGVISSTPPPTPAHDFVSYAQVAEHEGYYAKYDIYESGYAPEVIERFKKEAGGEKSTTWRREYLCEFVVDEELAIIPEWKDEYVEEAPRDEFFKFYFTYAGMDLGVKDFTALCFGYYDFKRGTLYVEDEITMKGPRMTTVLLTEAVREKEKELWGQKKVYRRVSDNNNPLLIQDLGSLHGLNFAPTTKENLDAMVNELRLYVSAGRVRVSPRCKHLIGCLKYGVWEENRRQFARSAVYGHFDGLAALIYLVRNLDVTTNPIPPLYQIDEQTHFIKEGAANPQSKHVKVLQKMMGLSEGRFN